MLPTNVGCRAAGSTGYEPDYAARFRRVGRALVSTRSRSGTTRAITTSVGILSLNDNFPNRSFGSEQPGYLFVLALHGAKAKGQRMQRGCAVPRGLDRNFPAGRNYPHGFRSDPSDPGFVGLLYGRAAVAKKSDHWGT